MNSVALEFVPPSVKAGPAGAVEEAKKAKRLMEKSGLADCINSIFIPHLIEEGEDRPVALEPKMDPLVTRNNIFKELPLSYIVAQVTFFSSTDQLNSRLKQLQKAAIERIVFVGVPRTMADGEGAGMSPADALKYFKLGTKKSSWWNFTSGLLEASASSGFRSACILSAPMDFRSRPWKPSMPCWMRGRRNHVCSSRVPLAAGDDCGLQGFIKK